MQKGIMEWWNTPIERIHQTPREFIITMGSRYFDVDTYVDSDFAEPLKNVLENNLTYTDDLDPRVTEYWKARGITRVVYGDPSDPSAWTIYYAEKDVQKGKPLPLMVNVYSVGVAMLSLEGLGFVHIAAENGFMVLVPKDGNDDAHVLAAIEAAKAKYPVDEERIYLAGHSFGGVTTGRQTISHPDIYAGACVMGSEYGGADNTPEEKERAAALRMPMVTISGTAEVQGILPFNQDPPDNRGPAPRVVPNLTPLAHTCETCMETIRFWRSTNGCKAYTMEEDTRDLPTLAERRFGARADRAEVREILGKAHYVLESLGAEGKPILRCVAIEGCPHSVASTAAPLAWEFLKQFRRDKVTKQICYIEQEKAFERVEADIRYDGVGPMIVGLRLKLKDGVDVSALKPMDFSICAYTDMHLVYRMCSVIAMDRQPGELYLMTQPLSADEYAPVYGGRVYRGGFRVTCRVPGFDFTSADVAEYHRPQLDGYELRDFDGAGYTPFDYVRYVSPRKEKLPLVVFATGCGPHNNETHNEQVMSHGPLKMISPAFQAEHPCHIIAPWYPLGGHPKQGEEGQKQLDDFELALTALVRQTMEELNVDPERVYFIGTGGGALYQQLHYGAELYAAAAMLTTIFDYFADGSEMKYLDRLDKMPIYITHGTNDFPCPVRRARLVYSRLMELGNRNVFYHEYTDAELERFGIDTHNQVGSHSSSMLDYAGEELYRWLFHWSRKDQI